MSKNTGMSADEMAGIYVHVPFCEKKCPYCDFYSITDLGLKGSYIQAVKREMGLAGPVPFSFDTIYFGGGTPSLLSPSEVGSIIETAHKNFEIHPETEITLEVNPGAVNPENFRDYLSAGVNRMNIGVQSFSDANLKILGRIHSSKDGCTAIDLAKKAGFTNLGIDLIYGLPGQDKKSWLGDLKQAVTSEPEHLSCYMLTCEPGTPLYEDHQEGKFAPLPDGRVKNLFEVTMEFLGSNGYFHYETSNFTRIDSHSSSKHNVLKYQSRHNRKYWSGASYLGFGPAAHSFISPVRYWNLRSVGRYIDTVATGHRPIIEKEVLTREQLMMEAVFLGLRTTDGIDIRKFDHQFNVSFHHLFRHVLSDLQDQELLAASHHRSRLTRKGMIFLDTVAGLLIEKIET